MKHSIFTVMFIMNIWHPTHMTLFSPGVSGILEWLLQHTEQQQMEAVVSMSKLAWVKWSDTCKAILDKHRLKGKRESMLSDPHKHTFIEAPQYQQILNSIRTDLQIITHNTKWPCFYMQFSTGDWKHLTILFKIK